MIVLSHGFRPFFLLAAALAVLQMPIWLLGLFGVMPSPGVSWHAHEMLFGFTAAVIAGFLLTAARHWTGRDTASGASLLLLCVLWGAGRVAISAAHVLPVWLVATVDVAFLPTLAFFIARPIIAVRQWRQLAILVVLSALALSNLAFHLFSGAEQRRAWFIALDVILVLITIIGGRVIPMFTRNAASVSPWSHPWLERAVLVSMLSIVLLEGHRAQSLACIVAALLQAWRLAGWRPLRTLRIPLLWVLHLGYAWLCVGLFVRGLGVAESAAIHFLTTGALGTLVLGMICRVALGHTGRPLVAPPAAVAGFVLLLIATPVRALLPLLLPSFATWFYAIAGSAWTLAFALYLVRYAGWLVTPRADEVSA
jgi:uncharacterized protein involved in response to NO